jgi:hypothetical protein
MSARAARYQEQVTGRPANQSFETNGVRFDGYKEGRLQNVLIDAKGPGYQSFVEKIGDTFRAWFSGQDALVSQANRQIRAAQGRAIEWHVAEPRAALAIRELLGRNGLSEIRVINTPPIQ